MSENLTHTAVTDDLARLSLHAADICDAFKTAFDQQLEAARLGGSTRHGHYYFIDLLRDYRDRWPEDQMLARKLAFVLGWFCHRAADLQMKPVFRATCPNASESPTDCSIYNDIFVLRHVYGGGREKPYSPGVVEQPVQSLPGADVTTEQMEEVFRVLLQRALLALHTFIPDETDLESVDAWIGQLIGRMQRYRVDIGRYAEAFANPDPDKVRRFIEEINFYDPDDGLIRLARSIQRGQPDESVDLEQALGAAEDASHYAQALRRGFLYLRGASRFFERRLDEEPLRECLEMGGAGQ